MKKAVLIICILLLWALPAFAMKNSPDGFRGIKWGDPTSALGTQNNIKYEGESGGFDIYTRTNDKLSIGDVSLDFIAYYFCNNKFVALAFDCKSSDSDMIMRIFRERYGDPEQPNKYIKEYQWKDGNALIIIKEDKFNKLVNVYMSSREQFNIAMKYLDERAKAAQSDF